MNDRLPTLTLIGVNPQSLRLEVQYDFAGQLPNGVRPFLRTTAGVFAEIGAHGAFPYSVSAPFNSKLTFMGDIAAAASHIVHEMSCSNIDPRAFQCLRNMARKLRKNDITISRLLVTDTDRPRGELVELPWPTEENEESIYPNALPNLAPIIQFEDSDFAKSRRCLIEIDTPLESDTVKRFEAWVESWYKLLEAGGYAPPIGPAEELESIAGTVNQFDQHSIEIGIDRFLASEKAWNALANMAEAFWVPTLRKIVID